MKLVQLNAWMGRLNNLVIDFVKSENPDILCLQEVFSSDAPVAYPENRLFDTFGLIKETGLFNDYYFSPGVQMDIAGGTADFGNAIFSKFPITRKETVFTDGDSLVKHFTSILDEEAKCNPARTLQLIDIAIGNQVFTVANQHFHWARSPLGDEVSAEKMRIATDAIKGFAGDNPLIVSGDFNIVNESPAMRVFDGWLRDLTSEYRIDTTLSGLKYKDLKVACDHILVSNRITVNNFEVKNKVVSDHFPLILEFDV